MKTRKSLANSEAKYKGKSVDNNKTKVKRVAKAIKAQNDISYRDAHNIGRRKSADSVVTYSLNSHLFFDVYAKFDQNISAKSIDTSKLSRKSSRNSLEKIPCDSDILPNSASGDVSTEAMSANECHSNKSSPKRLKVVCEAEPVNKDEVIIPSPQMDVASPFKSPRQSRVSSPKKAGSKSKFQSINQEEPSQKPDTFHKRFDNKTVFKKNLVKKSKMKLKQPEKVKRRVSERLCKTSKKPEDIDHKDDGKVTEIIVLTTNKGKLKGIPKKKLEGILDATSIINVRGMTSSKICDFKMVEDDIDNIKVELDVDEVFQPELQEAIVVATNKDLHNDQVGELEGPKENLEDEVYNKCCKSKDSEAELAQESLVNDRKKVPEKRKEVKDCILATTVSKKVAKKNLNCFFDIMATGSQRECERSNIKSVTAMEATYRPWQNAGEQTKASKGSLAVEVHNRVTASGDHRDQGKFIKNSSSNETPSRICLSAGEQLKGAKSTSASKKLMLLQRNDEDTKKEAIDEEGSGETLWLWFGDGQEKSIKLKLDGEVMTRTCYPAIKHTKDDVVIRVMDCVMLRSADQEPYLAKITAFFDDEESGKKMMAVLWYYRPEHTDQGRLMWHTESDVYASRHLDTNSVDCIEDKAFVLPIELYARFMSYQKRQSSTSRQGLSARMVPMIVDDMIGLDLDDPRLPSSVPMDVLSMDMFASSFYYGSNFQFSFPSEMTSSNVFVCRGVYDMGQHKVTEDVLQWVQSPPVHEPLIRCMSVGSAMSISSCNSEDPDHHQDDRSVQLTPRRNNNNNSSSNISTLPPSIPSTTTHRPHSKYLSTSNTTSNPTIDSPLVAVNGSMLGSYHHRNGHY